MSKINAELDDTLKTLESFGVNIKDNVITLSDDIGKLESKIEESAKESFNEIKDSLDTLKEKVDSSIERFNLSSEFNESEHSKLLIEYYSSIIFIKNDYMNTSLKIIDKLNSAFEDYNKERNTFYVTINGILKDQIESTDNIIEKCVSFILKSLDNYKGILSKYSELFSSSFSDIKKEIESINKIFTKEYDEMHNKIRTIKNNYSLSSSGDHFIKVNPDNIEDPYNSSIEMMTLDYSNKKDMILNDFRCESRSDLDRIEYILLNILGKTYSLSIDNNDLTSLLKDSEFKELSNTLKEINDKFDINEFKEVVNNVYKSKNERQFKLYESRLRELERVYKRKLENYGYILNGLNVVDSNLNDESMTFYNEYSNELILKEDIADYKKYTKERIDCLFDYKIKTLRLFLSINEITSTYDYEKSVIEASFMKEMRDSIIKLDYEIDIIKNEANVKRKETDSFMMEMELTNKKATYLVDFQKDSFNIQREYELKKQFLRLAYELFNKEKEIALLDSRGSLEKTLSQYEAISSAFLTIYKSQETLLLRNKERSNMFDVSNYEYAYTFLNHRTLIAKEMLDLAKREYNLRIDILNETRNNTKGYLEKIIEPIIDMYLNDIKELSRIKDEKLEPLIKRLSKRSSGDMTNDEVRLILSEYNSTIDALSKMLVNDRMVSYSRRESRNIDEAVINAIDNAQMIRNQSINRALNEMKSASDEFEAILKSLDQNEIDFNLALEDYKLTYLINKGKLDTKLDQDTSKELDDIKEINKKYDNKNFIKKFDEIEDDYDKKTSSLIDEYNKKVMSLVEIEKENYVELLYSLNENSLKSFNDAIKTNENRFILDKNTAYSIYIRNMSDLKKESIKKAKSYKLEVERFKGMELDMIDDISKMNSSSIKFLKKTSYIKNIFDLEELKEIEKSFKSNLKKINREVDKKYKNISVYDFSKLK